tara:strand:- start:114 stop:374 length:261 start_codon:yes stop_codon:yes gene_type:complete
LIPKSPVMRICIACRQTYDRKNLLKITNDHKLGIMFHKGIGRSAYICKSKKCYTDSKIKKKLQKALKMRLDLKFFDIFEKEIANYN